MKPIGMPVYRPTRDYIWNSFQNSKKRHLIVTGGRKSGKTTLLNSLSHELPGILTWAEPKKAVYLKELMTGESTQIGVYDDNLPGMENKMVLCREGFENLGIPALERCIASDSEWIMIDEIGYLETGCKDYCEAILRLMEKKRLIAAVRKQDIAFLQEICKHRDVFLVDLDAPFGNLGCVIMASGMGKRFGCNKLMADFDGEPLICRAIAATEGIFVRRVVVTRHKEVEALCRNKGVEVLLHDLPGRNDTVRLGLEAVGDVDGCLFCPGDQPLLRKETVEKLAAAAVKEPERIWRTVFEKTPGAPVLFPEWAYMELRTLPEGKGGGVVAKKYPEQVRMIPVRDKNELRDVDCPEDLTELLDALQRSLMQ